MKEDHYLTVGQLRKAIKDLPDDTKVFYQRIEDVYFSKYGWEPDKLIADPGILHLHGERIYEEWLRAFTAYKSGDGDLLITAHY